MRGRAGKLRFHAGKFRLGAESCGKISHPCGKMSHPCGVMRENLASVRENVAWVRVVREKCAWVRSRAGKCSIRAGSCGKISPSCGKMSHPCGVVRENLAFVRENVASVRTRAGKSRLSAGKISHGCGVVRENAAWAAVAHAGNPLRETFPYSYHFRKCFFVYIKGRVVTQPQGLSSKVTPFPGACSPNAMLGYVGSSPPPPTSPGATPEDPTRPDPVRSDPTRFDRPDMIFRGERCAIGAFTCLFLGDNVGLLVVGVLVACTTRRVSGIWLARFGWIPASSGDVLPCYPLHCCHNLHWPCVGFLCFIPTRWNSFVNL